MTPYLRHRASESGEVIDYRDWHVLLPGAEAVVGAAQLRRDGLRHHVREHIALAGELGLRIDEHPRLERSAAVVRARLLPAL